MRRKRAATYQRKRMWLGGICLSLSVAVAACGTDGRTAGSREAPDAQSMQEEQAVQKGQDKEGAQDRQDAQTAQGVQETEGTENVQNTSATQDLQETAGTQNAEALRAQVLSEMTDEQKNWMGGLSEEQRLADFGSLCEGLRENYPYVKLASRQAGADLDVLERTYQEKVEQCANDDAFFYVLKEFAGEFSYTGHLALWGLRYESELASAREYVKEPGQEKRYQPYVDALDNPVSRKTYAAMTAYYEEVDRLTEKKRAAENGGERGEEAEAGEAAAADGETAAVEAMPANVETKILEPGKTAYVFIDAFDHGQMETDREILLPFYDKVRTYDNLIIDITNNLGGSMAYFDELVVAPLTKETLTVPGFDGKIWLLVSENNYSSSEYAAMFSKASGFATLVGRTTSGDGIGTDPIYLILPNSGLVVQYSPMYGVTADGTGSEACGTNPDIVSPEGESALETCLRQIGQESWKKRYFVQKQY